jgi:FAD:protein FMN transferase
LLPQRVGMASEALATGRKAVAVCQQVPRFSTGCARKMRRQETPVRACARGARNQPLHIRRVTMSSTRSPARTSVRSLWDRTKAALSAPAPLHARDDAAGAWLARDEVAMGTAIRVELWCEDAARGNAAIDAVMAEMHRIDRTMSPHKPDSELSRINRDAEREAVALSNEMFVLLVQAQRFSLLSHGAFDITFASVGNLYDYREGMAPSAQALARGRAAIGWKNLELDARTRSVKFAREGMRIDLGGFAKGLAVDNAAAILARHGIHHAHVAAGGDSRVIGDKRGRPWTIGVRDPRKSEGLIALLPLEDSALSTSGDYERFFERDGVRHHHIVDPATGASPASVRSVTVLAADGLTCEALSKTVFVLGARRGLELIETLQGVDAIVVDAAGELHYSSGMSAGRTPARH